MDDRDRARAALRALPPIGAEEIALLEALAAALRIAGDSLHVVGYITRLDPIADARVAVQMTGELAAGVVTLLAADNWYAAMTLVRQLLELQYLLAAFVRDPDAATRWRASTRQQRSGTGPFSPSTLRQAGNFAVDDYRSHCDRGGHPTPLGTFLVRFDSDSSSEDERISVALAWRDVANHLVQVSRQVIEFARTLDLTAVVDDVDCAASAGAAWLATDGRLLIELGLPGRES